MSVAVSSTATFRPPPGLESTQSRVSLTSIASILIPGKKGGYIESEDNKIRVHHNTTPTKDQQQQQQPTTDGYTVDDRHNKQKRSTELAAVANNCALNNDFEAAISFYTEAISLNLSDFRFYCNRSFCYENLKQFESALEDAETAIQLNPYRPKPYFRKGRALVGLKRYEDAEEAFKQVLKIDPDCEATILELIQLRYVAMREIGFDIDAALLAAKRCNSITEAIDFVVNIELLSLKTGERFDYQSENRISNNSLEILNGSNPVMEALAPSFGKLKVKHDTKRKDNSCLQSFSSTSSVNSSEDNFSRPKIESKTAKKDTEGPTNLFGYKGLWVGNVSPKTNINMLKALFAKFGTVHCAKVLKDKFCAFISYDNPNSPRKAIADLYESCVEGISNEWRPLKFRFIPTGEQPDLNYARPVQPRNNNNECYFWRTTGCNAGDKCKLRHISICKGIDFQPWMRK